MYIEMHNNTSIVIDSQNKQSSHTPPFKATKANKEKIQHYQAKCVYTTIFNN